MPDLDHRMMAPPFLRAVHTMRTSGSVGVWDLRLSPPNVAAVPSDVMHSLEHFLNDQLRETSDSVLLVAPMGCGTGLYIVTTIADFPRLAHLTRRALIAVLTAEAVPLANDVECGRAEHHSLAGAQHAARYLLDRFSDWPSSVIANAD